MVTDKFFFTFLTNQHEILAFQSYVNDYVRFTNIMQATLKEILYFCHHKLQETIKQF